jgi:hypothetical protein
VVFKSRYAFTAAGLRRIHTCFPVLCGIPQNLDVRWISGVWEKVKPLAPETAHSWNDQRLSLLSVHPERQFVFTKPLEKEFFVKQSGAFIFGVNQKDSPSQFITRIQFSEPG